MPSRSGTNVGNPLRQAVSTGLLFPMGNLGRYHPDNGSRQGEVSVQIDFQLFGAVQPRRGGGARARRPGDPRAAQRAPPRSCAELGRGTPTGSTPRPSTSCSSRPSRSSPASARPWTRPPGPGRHPRRAVAPLHGRARAWALMCSGTHPFTDWADPGDQPQPALRPADRGHAVAGPPAADLRHPRARRRALAGEGDADRQRAAPVHPALPRAVGVLARSGRAPTPGWRRAAARCSRACRPPGCPTSSPAGTSSSSFMDTLDLGARRSRRSARCGGTSGRTPTSAPSSCASATACRRWTRSAAVAALSPVPGRAARHPARPGLHAADARASWIVRENKWRAARYGLDAEIIVDDAGHGSEPVRRGDRWSWSTSSRRSPSRLGCERGAAPTSRGSCERRRRATSGSARSRPRRRRPDRRRRQPARRDARRTACRRT